MNFLEDGHPYLYGKLNKEVELVKLKGKETPTTTTEIDEENNIGVNVKDSIIIGDSYINDSNELIIESRDKSAAPLVTLQLGDFKQEQSDMAMEDESNETFIKNKSTKYLKNEGEDGSSKYTTEAALNAEIDRAKNAEVVLDTKITTETNRAINKENELSESISDEVSRATERENILDTKITDETNRATDAETELKSKWDDFGLTQGNQKYSIVQKRIKSDGSIVSTEAYQRASISVGGDTVAGDKNGNATDYSFAFAANESNEAIARSSAAFGRYNKTFNPGEFVCGNYSEENRSPETVFLVGGGATPDKRHNAFEVRTKHTDEDDISSAFIGGDAVATEEYVNTNAVKKENTPQVVYSNEADGKASVMPYRFNKQSIIDAEYTLMLQPMYNGRMYTRDPIDDYHVVNKRFVDVGLDAKYDKTGGVINGEVVITGDLTVNGTQHINNTENLDVKNAMIYSNSDGATLASNGGLGIKTNSTDVYGIVYDPVGDSVKLGLGKSDTNGKFTFNANEGNPIAVRDDDSKLTNDKLLKWNSTNRKLVDSGKSVDDLSTATNLENGEGVGSLIQKETTYDDILNEFVPYMVTYVENVLHYTAPPTSSPVAQATLVAMGFTSTQASALISAVGYANSVAVGILIGSGFYTQTEAISYISTNGNSSTVVSTALVEGNLKEYGITRDTDLSNKANSSDSFSMGSNSTVNSLGGVAFGIGNIVGDENSPSEGIASIAVGIHNYNKGIAAIVAGKDLKNYESTSAMFGNGNSKYKVESNEYTKQDQRIYLNNLAEAGGDVEGSGDNRVGIAGVNKGFNSLLCGYAHWNGAINSSILGNQNIIGEHDVSDGNPCANNFIGNGLINFIDRSNSCAILGWHNIIKSSTAANLFGYYLKAEGRARKTVVGSYNEDKDNTYFEVGNGTSDTDRKNAFEVLKDGRAKLQSAPTESTDVVRKLELDKKLDDSILTVEQVNLLF